MLNLMRKKAGSWMIKVILALIVVVFMFWGVGNFRNRQATVVASVDGIPIGYNEYNRAYDDLQEQFKRQFGNNLNDETIKMLGIKRMALDRIINRRIMLAEARRLGFKISDKELSETIQTIPAFQRNGAFDNNAYQQTINQLRMTPEAFEKDYRDSMLIENLRLFVTDQVKVSELEARQWYDWQNTSVSINYLMVDPNQYQGLKPTASELAAYFKKNQENYKTDPKVKVRYVKFDAGKYLDPVKISDDEVQEYYDNHAEAFSTPKTVEARHIIIKVDPDADKAAVETARKKILDILAMAREGKDFATLAKTYSEGPSRARGGLLGAFKKEDMVAPFSDKAFSMAEGEISDPVRTRFGWHLIKVEKINPAKKQPLESSADKIKKTLAEQKAKEMAYDDAESFLDLVFENDDMAQVARERKKTVMTTGYFDRKGPSEIAAGRDKFTTAAFALNTNEVSDILELGNAYYLLQLAERKPAAIPPLADVVQRVRQDWVKMQQDKKAKADATALLAEIKKGTSPLAAGKTRGLTLQTTDFFNRNAPVPGIGSEPGISQKAFQLTQAKQMADQVIKGQKGFYVIQLKERQLPDAEGFAKQEDAIVKRLKNEKTRKRYNTFLARLKEKSEIEIKPEFKQL